MFGINPRNDFEPVHSMLMQSIAAKAVMGAVELKLFDYMEGGGGTVAELADRLGLVADRLEPLMDILVAATIVQKNGSRYANTAMSSEFLMTSKPLYQGLSMQLTMQFIGSVDGSIAGLIAGETIDRNTTDDQWSEDDVMEGTAQEAKGSGLVPVVNMIAELPGFSKFRTMCDIGGNHGMFTLGLLERNEAMSGVIFDLPHVAEQAQKRCDSLGFSHRVVAKGLDFRKDRLPDEQFDLALTSHVLYAFKDNLNDALGWIADGMRPGGWFVSHHYAGRGDSGKEMTTASLELLTRLCGYPSHFIEQDELSVALSTAGFEDIRYRRTTENGLGLITAAQKSR